MKKPLVSISIETYNSSDYIIEALESAKAQTYSNIELIISDDCSTDNTLDIINKWLNVNKQRFVNVKLLTVEKNTGVTANTMRAWNACSGEWIKDLAGDDVLLPNCVEDNLIFLQKYKDASIVLSDSIVFYDNSEKTYILKPCEAVPSFFDMSSAEQYEALIAHDEITLNPVGEFIRTSIAISRKPDDRIKNMEDRQFFWNCTSNGIKIYYLAKETVKYRKHDGALTGSSGDYLLSVPFWDSWVSFFYIIRKPEMEKRGLNTQKDERKVLVYLIVKQILKNKGNFFTRFVHRVIRKIFIN